MFRERNIYLLLAFLSENVWFSAAQYEIRNRKEYDNDKYSLSKTIQIGKVEIYHINNVPQNIYYF